MEDDEQKSRKEYPVSTAKMSKTPSWIMLGFLLGAAFVAALPPFRKQPPETATFRASDSPKPSTPREPPQLTTIEAVFAEWGRFAVWSDDLTEVALWNSQDKAFTDFYEVRRVGGTFYFRTIPQLTRRIIAHGKPLPESPLQFTETEEQYREWLAFGRMERPVDRDARPGPNYTNPAAPAPVDRSLKITPPTLPPPGSGPTMPPMETPPVKDGARK